MEREDAQQTNYEAGDSDSFFEIEFDSVGQQQNIDNDQKQRIRQELMSLDW